MLEDSTIGIWKSEKLAYDNHLGYGKKKLYDGIVCKIIDIHTILEHTNNVLYLFSDK